jgi:hypothetical protein
VQNENRPQIGPEAAEAALELVAVDDVPRVVADERRHHRRELDLDGPTLSTAHGIEAGVDGQSMEPGVEALRITQSGKVAPGSDVGILDRVARELRVPEDEAGDSFQPRDGRVDKPREGVMIAPPRSFDEISLVHSHPR